jgi:hypothetical protein
LFRLSPPRLHSSILIRQNCEVSPLFARTWITSQGHQVNLNRLAFSLRGSNRGRLEVISWHLLSARKLVGSMTVVLTTCKLAHLEYQVRFSQGGVKGKERPRRPEFAGRDENGTARTRPRWLKRSASSMQRPSSLSCTSWLRA